jgi:23S rRNA-/tRNA-specific pseudouridylate synthase
VHLKAIHHPIVCDPLYATGFFKEGQGALGVSRLALHAYSLDLPLPGGTRTTIVAPIPTDLAPALASFSGLGEQFALS